MRRRERSLLGCCLVGLVAGCGGAKPPSPHIGFPACETLLHDQRLAGMRLVEATSYGSGADLCFYAPASVHTATASASNPVPGKRVVVPKAGGAATFSDMTFTTPPVDPGDAGPASRG